jgi:hypothetical protein
MARLLLPFIIAVTFLFALAIQVVGGLAYDSDYFQQVESFLTPPGDCPSPCFMGIRPGFMTADQAIAILKRHPWVEKVTVSADLENSFGGSIYWTWSAALPSQIDRYWQGHIVIVGGMVRNIRVRTNVRYGDLLVLFGRPQNGGFASASGDDYLLHRTVYVANGLETESYVACPLHLEQIWDAAVLMNVRLTSTDVIPKSGYHMHTWLDTSRCER